MLTEFRSDTDRQDDQRSEVEGMRAPVATSAEAGQDPRGHELKAERTTGQARGRAEWISQPNHRQGQYWNGGPRPMNAPPPAQAKPGSSSLSDSGGYAEVLRQRSEPESWGK
jgi:hypothetical protein